MDLDYSTYELFKDELDEKNSIVLSNNKECNISFKLDNAKVIKFSEKPKLSFHKIESFIDMENSYEAYFSYCSQANHIAYRYLKNNGFYPTTYRFVATINYNSFLNNLFKYYKVPKNSFIKASYEDFIGSKTTVFIIAFSPTLILDLMMDGSGVLYYNINDEEDKDSLLYTITGLLKSCKLPKVSKNKIYIVYNTKNGFDKKGFNVKKIDISIKENYNDEFEEMSEKIINGLNSKDKTNLVILSGVPGVGKTTFIRYLTSKLKKNIIFVSPDMVNSITDPAFIPFLMDNNNSILIIEDAEPALEKRSSGGRNSAVSNVLNLTDGLLSDCLNISIVATFNTGTKSIDDALLRKGRLLMNYKFEKLNIEKSKALLKKLGHSEVEVTEPMTLSDIYYYGENNNAEVKERKIGFK